MTKKSNKETFLLVSLQEPKAKKLAQVMSNESCRKILDYLANVEDATETKISKELKIPISTVHYNLTHLEKGGLVDIEEFHYSEKGKEVNHYKLANKFIIISPKSTESVKEKLIKRLGSLLPAMLVTVLVGGVVQVFSSMRSTVFGAADMVVPVAKQVAVEKSAEVMMTVAPEAADAGVDVLESSAPIAVQSISHSMMQYPGYWFIAGVVCFVIVYIIWQLVKKE